MVVWGPEPAKITLWASTRWPSSQARVTSEKSLLSTNSPKEELPFLNCGILLATSSLRGPQATPFPDYEQWACMPIYCVLSFWPPSSKSDIPFMEALLKQSKLPKFLNFLDPQIHCLTKWPRLPKFPKLPEWPKSLNSNHSQTTKFPKLPKCPKLPQSTDSLDGNVTHITKISQITFMTTILELILFSSNQDFQNYLNIVNYLYFQIQYPTVYPILSHPNPWTHIIFKWTELPKLP